MEKYYNPFKEKTVKENDDYVLGLYVDRVPVYGLYIEGQEKFIKELEIKAKAKFKLECDPENYAQHVRMYYYVVLEKYLDKFGVPATLEDKNNMEKYICKGCLNKLKDLSRCMKSKISYFDEEVGEVVFNTIVSLDAIKDSSEKNFYIDNLEYSICSSNVDEHYNCFTSWFGNIKGELLTRKQLEYLKDGNVVSDKNKKTIEKNIIKRIDKSYSDLSIQECKAYELNRKLDLIKELLESCDVKELFVKLVGVLDDEDWLLEELYSLDLSTCKIITDATKGIYSKNNKEIYKICCKLIEIEKKIEKNVKKYKK